MVCGWEMSEEYWIMESCCFQVRKELSLTFLTLLNKIFFLNISTQQAYTDFQQTPANCIFSLSSEQWSKIKSLYFIGVTLFPPLQNLGAFELGSDTLKFCEMAQ